MYIACDEFCRRHLRSSRTPLSRRPHPGNIQTYGVRRAAAGVQASRAGGHPSPMTRDFDLLDGSWYASQPFADWAWMREHAPAYWDAKNEVWAITRYDDVLAVEKDPATFSSHRAPRPHGRAPPDDDLDGRPRALAPPQAREPRLHAAAGARPRSDDPPHLHGRSSTGSRRRGSATSSGTSPRRCRSCSSPTCSASRPSPTTTCCAGPTT